MSLYEIHYVSSKNALEQEVRLKKQQEDLKIAFKKLCFQSEHNQREEQAKQMQYTNASHNLHSPKQLHNLYKTNIYSVEKYDMPYSPYMDTALSEHAIINPNLSPLRQRTPSLTSSESSFCISDSVTKLHRKGCSFNTQVKCNAKTKTDENV